jgi:ABC-2 type transport system ATP-binding protein
VVKTMPVLTVLNLSKNFKKTEAVKNLSFTLKKGEIAALIGPNGAGKTTTLKCIMNSELSEVRRS